MAHDVFISYPSKDKTVADAVCAKLEEMKIRCWVAPRDIPAGQNFARAIIEAIDSSKIFVLIWSVNTNASEHILNEINQAFDKGIPIIPFRIQDVQPTSEMRYYFGRTHWLDALTPPLEKHLETLAKVILANLSQAPVTIPQPVPVKVEPLKEFPQGEKIDRITSAKKSAPKTDAETETVPAPIPGIRTIKRNAQESIGGVYQPDGKSRAKKRILISMAAAIVIIGAAFAILLKSGVIKGSTFFGFAPLPSATVSVDDPFSVTPSNIPSVANPSITPSLTTITPTPIPVWVKDFSEPVLSAIANSEPDFQDDFSKPTYFWSFGFCDRYDPIANSGSISNGKLLLNTARCFAKASLGYIYLDNFAVQFEIDLRQVDNNNSTEFNFGNGDLLSLSGNNRWGSENCRLGTCFNRMGGIFPHSFIETDTITYISYSTKNAIYINDIPIYYFTDSDQDPGQLSIRILSMNDNEMNSVAIDYIKIWDLDKVENISAILK